MDCFSSSPAAISTIVDIATTAVGIMAVTMEDMSEVIAAVVVFSIAVTAVAGIPVADGVDVTEGKLPTRLLSDGCCLREG